MGTLLLPDAVLFRTRSGAAYIEATLSHDFSAVRSIAFPGDKRRLMDMRRSGVVEAIAGKADPLGLSAKLANSISRSNALRKTYAPVDIEAVRNADEARLRVPAGSSSYVFFTKTKPRVPYMVLPKLPKPRRKPLETAQN
jgi:hypothetical protein